MIAVNRAYQFQIFYKRTKSALVALLDLSTLAFYALCRSKISLEFSGLPFYLSDRCNECFVTLTRWVIKPPVFTMLGMAEMDRQRHNPW